MCCTGVDHAAPGNLRYGLLMRTGDGMVLVGTGIIVITFTIELFKPSKAAIAASGNDSWAALFIEILKDMRSFLIALGLAIMVGDNSVPLG